MSKETKDLTRKKGFWYYYDKVVDFLALMAGASLAAIAVIITADVIARYAFNKPFGFTDSLGELILVLILALGGTYLLRVQDFIRVDIVMQFVPERVRVFFRCITDLIAAVVFWVICYGSVVKFVELWQTKAIIINSGGNWRHWVYMAPMVVFYFVIPFQFIRNSIAAFKEYREHRRNMNKPAVEESADAAL